MSHSVSVVVPTANRRPHEILRAVDSVLSQSSGRALSGVELIVANNSSGRLNRAIEVLAESGALQVVDASRVTGVSHARNAGARLARHEVLAFLDDDDWWSPSFLSDLLLELDAHSADLCSSGFWVWTERGKKPGPMLESPTTAARFLSENPGITGSNFIIRRSAFEALGGFDEALFASNDGDFMIRFLESGEYAWRVVMARLVNVDRTPHDQVSVPTPRRVQSMRRFQSIHGAKMGPRVQRDFEYRLAVCEAASNRSYWDLVGLIPRHPRWSRQTLGWIKKLALGRHSTF
ncbi:MAG: glycosyltransferase family 2 protein [Deltaproteobacteria bacterium]|nr:glycosyltransferase family 2 protein [Deltaproteobacteria bacterium]